MLVQVSPNRRKFVELQPHTELQFARRTATRPPATGRKRRTMELNVTKDKVFLHEVTLKLSVETAEQVPYYAYQTTLSDRTAAAFP